MKEINIGSLGGIHYEMYDPDPQNLHTTRILQHFKQKPDFLNLNGVFWSKLLSEENVSRLVDVFLDNTDLGGNAGLAERMIQCVPEQFKLAVQEAKDKICEQGSLEREYFGYLETLALVCKLYSSMYFSPFELTIQEGFLLDSYSSVEMLKDCLTPSKNPYYWFLEKYVWRELMNLRPECVWINGRLTLANMAVAKYLKNRMPQVKIFWAMPGTEYYAVNKIDEYLKYNLPLFTVIDGIVLDDFEETRKHIIEVLQQGKGLNGIYNIMYAQRDGTGQVQIHQGCYKKYSEQNSPAIEVSRRTIRKEYGYNIAPWEIVNVRFYPHKICSWNKCAFCGINKKYKTMGHEAELEDKITELYRLHREGCNYFWFIDEEISAAYMEQFSRAVLDRGLKIKWQIRARISKEFADPKLCRLLAEAGLKEIRFGLESASYRILKQMNKVDEDFSLQLVERLVEMFQNAGVYVHFPVIIGFPGETDIEREQTYQFLRYLRNKYDKVSFNVNVLGLDVSSDLFKNWEHYGITKIEFPCNPHHFLANLVSWNCAEIPFLEDELKFERDNFMREQLYPWMPEDALVCPHIFYRLMETIRNTLTVKDRIENAKCGIDENIAVQWNSFVIVQTDFCYNIKEHQKMMSSIDLLKVKEIFEKPIILKEALARLTDVLTGYTLQDTKNLIQQLWQYGFLV